MTYQEALTYLYNRLPMFQRIGAAALKTDLSNTIKLLEAIGNPHKALKTIHIAGTNGKGTSAHTLAAILQEAGYKTGLYTSPHLKSFTERIKIDGQEIDTAYIADFVKHHQDLIEIIQPSFFEVTVMMAFAYFKEMKVDIAVIETGLGGRLDSTNVIKPELSLITMIGKDHAELLGDTLQKIAKEKAGIIKKGVPVVIGAFQEETITIFQENAEQVNAPLYLSSDVDVKLTFTDQLSKGYQLIANDQTLEIETDITADYFALNIPGIIKSVELLNKGGFIISNQSIVDGFRQIKSTTGLKGRMQVINDLPLTIADISHNEPGLIALMNQLKETVKGDLHLIFGVVRDKDLQSIFKVLPNDARFYWTQSGVPRSLPANELKEKAAVVGLIGKAYENVNDAIKSANEASSKDDVLVICGSAFVVAEIDNL